MSGLSEAYVSMNVLGVNGSTLVVTGYQVNDGNSGHDYSINLVPASGTITPAALTISAVSATKIYDGSTLSTATPSVVGLIGTDNVTGLTERFNSKNVLGNNSNTLQVTSYIVNDGNGGRNYGVTLQTATGTITPATLIVNATTNSKVYDATTVAHAVPTVSGLKGGDSATNLVEAYFSKDVLGANSSTLHVTGYKINDGNGGANYTVTTKTMTGTITPATLFISASTNTRIYNGTTSAAAHPTTTGLKGSDSVTGLTESYASKNVLGLGRSVLAVNSGYKVNDGNSGRDYVVTLRNASGSITPAPLTISATTNTKVYDGTTSASATPTVSGLVGVDTVTNLIEAYLSKNRLGTGKSTLKVTGYSINDGNNGANYVVTLKTAPGTIN